MCVCAYIPPPPFPLLTVRGLAHAFANVNMGVLLLREAHSRALFAQTSTAHTRTCAVVARGVPGTRMLVLVSYANGVLPFLAPPVGYAGRNLRTGLCFWLAGCSDVLVVMIGSCGVCVCSHYLRSSPPNQVSAPPATTTIRRIIRPCGRCWEGLGGGICMCVYISAESPAGAATGA